jgi:tryptophan synthase alpha chain
MSRYARMFERLTARGEGAFGGFLMLGDPDLNTSVGCWTPWLRAGRT